MNLYYRKFLTFTGGIIDPSEMVKYMDFFKDAQRKINCFNSSPNNNLAVI
jgi:hypothetical protein